MPLYDIFELDGAAFRRPASERTTPVTEVFAGGRWRPYQGDRLKPAMFGDHIRTVEMDD